MSRPHDRWTEEQERGYQRLRGYETGGAFAHPPDDASAYYLSCMLWIRRQGWMGRVDDWMIEWRSAYVTSLLSVATTDSPNPQD